MWLTFLQTWNNKSEIFVNFHRRVLDKNLGLHKTRRELDDCIDYHRKSLYSVHRYSVNKQITSH